ncbi:hypothetical protein I546_0447 [Mycobacterium kansasii 732]|nr:hypothetical protein I546_0447 [Mycobacterium kansasii 732]
MGTWRFHRITLVLRQRVHALFGHLPAYASCPTAGEPNWMRLRHSG